MGALGRGRGEDTTTRTLGRWDVGRHGLDTQGPHESRGRRPAQGQGQGRAAQGSQRLGTVRVRAQGGRRATQGATGEDGEAPQGSGQGRGR